MRSCFTGLTVTAGLIAIIWLGGSVSYGQDIPGLNEMSGCPDFMKSMLPPGGQIILCEFHPTPVNTTMEMKAEAGKTPIYGSAYEFEFKITYFDPKMGFWSMQKDEITRQENAKAEEKIQEEKRDAEQSPHVTGPVEVRQLPDGTGRGWYQKHVFGEDNVLGTSKKPLENIYSCDYLVIQEGLVISFHATAASKEMGDAWLQNIRAKLSKQGY